MLLLAANTNVYVLCSGQVSWLGVCSRCIGCRPRRWWKHADMRRVWHMEQLAGEGER